MSFSIVSVSIKHSELLTAKLFNTILKVGLTNSKKSFPSGRAEAPLLVSPIVGG